MPDCAKIRDNGLVCMACTIYWETRGEPVKGQYAVGMVTINRTRNDEFPPTICENVWKRTVKHGRIYPQYSWTVKPSKVTDPVAWTIAAWIAQDIIQHEKAGKPLHDPTHGALYFHSRKSRPGWQQVSYIARIGDHLFYK